MKSLIPKWDVDEAMCSFWVSQEASSCILNEFWKINHDGITKQLTFFYPNGLFKWCSLYDENINLGKRLINRMIKDHRNLVFIVNGFNSDFSKAFKYFKITDKLDLKKLSNRDLFKYFKELKGIYRSIWKFGFTIEAIDAILPEILEKELSRYPISQKEKEILFEIPEKSFAMQEKLELLRIGNQLIKKFGRAIKIGKITKSQFFNQIVKHREKYKWSLTGHAGKKEISNKFFVKQLFNYFKSDLNFVKEINKLDNYVKKLVKEKRKIVLKYNFKNRTLSLLKIVNEWGPIHDKRKMFFMNAIYQTETIMEEIGRRFSFSLKDLRCLRLSEILEFEREQFISSQEIKKRKALFVLSINRKQEKLFTGLKAKLIEKKELGEFYDKCKKLKNIYLKGSSANSGKIVGKAKIIFHLKEINKMKKGNILITGMTRPEILPVIKLASAIVTDEGGITCHAAIVAREFNIPCVVGTLFATKVLKDGDVIEVNANQGIVRKIK